jgi:3-methyladenine DNA glycosylase/8-oxoguanine DNA glycosylase
VYERIIQTEACVGEGAEYLAQLEPRFDYALHCVGKLPLRRRPDGFERLLGAIVSQQLSVAAADAIWKRIVAANLNGPRKIMKAHDDDLKAAQSHPVFSAMAIYRHSVTHNQIAARAALNILHPRQHKLLFE